jgi:hypothetical protein
MDRRRGDPAMERMQKEPLSAVRGARDAGVKWVMTCGTGGDGEKARYLAGLVVRNESKVVLEMQKRGLAPRK